MLYSNLPVFKASYDLLLNIFNLCKDMNREYKYTIGQDLKKEAIDLLIGIYRANSVHEKTEILQQTRERLELVRLYVRILKDLKQINLKKFTFLNIKMESVSKQLAGWQKSKK